MEGWSLTAPYLQELGVVSRLPLPTTFDKNSTATPVAVLQKVMDENNGLSGDGKAISRGISSQQFAIHYMPL